MNITEEEALYLSGNKIRPTKCWDCAKATGGCSWADAFIPVKGWKAIATTKPGIRSSYLILECPEFQADAMSGGQYWTKEHFQK